MTHTGVGEGQLIRQKGLDPYRRVLFINEDKAVNNLFFCCGCDGWLYCLCAA